MAVIEFENNTDEIIEEMRQKALAWLEEAGGDIRSQAATNSRRASGETAGSFQHKVDEESMVCSIGSSLENAVWEEFGTVCITWRWTSWSVVRSGKILYRKKETYI